LKIDDVENIHPKKSLYVQLPDLCCILACKRAMHGFDHQSSQSENTDVQLIDKGITASDIADT
jgi:hypothetical protein